MASKNIVVIGGGSGTDIVLSGLKRYACQLTALISTFDAGYRRRWQDNDHSFGGDDHDRDHASDREKDGKGKNSHGQSRTHEVANVDSARPYLHMDEVHSSLLALGADNLTTDIMQRLFAYRLSHPSGAAGYTLGNLLLSALTDITGAQDLALKAAARVLNVQGQVLPLTLNPCPLVAHLEDGRQVLVSTPAELRSAAAQSGLRRVSLAAPTPALDGAIEAIRQADVVVIGPADFYFNIIAPMQLEGLAQALYESGAIRILVCNILTEPYITAGWPASRFIRMAQEAAGGNGALDYVIVNSGPLPPEALADRQTAGYLPVQLDLEECLSLGLNVILRPVVSGQTLRHDPDRLARTILFLGGWRSTQPGTKRNARTASTLSGERTAEGLRLREAGY